MKRFRRGAVPRKGMLHLMSLVLGVVFSGTCFAIPIQFEFQSTATITNFAEVSIGDTVNWTVLADNGGTDLLSEAWEFSDIISGEIAAGSYVASFVAQSLSDVVFRTDATGALEFSSMVFCCFTGYDTALNSDSLGSISVLGARNALVADGDAFFWQPTDDTWDENQWTITEVNVPAPATLALFGFGFAILGWSRRESR